MDIGAIRSDYQKMQLDEASAAEDPFYFFKEWFRQAVDAQVDEVNAMVLSTLSLSGYPRSRVVLLKGVEEGAFQFFTNYQSDKGRELLADPRVSLVFFWKELERQVRIEGVAHKLSALESDAYFESRPLGSQIGAWASPQSQVIPSRAFLEENARQMDQKWTGMSQVPRPPHWGGFAVKPHRIEFWQGRSSRLHDRICYVKEQETWVKKRLAP